MSPMAEVGNQNTQSDLELEKLQRQYPELSEILEGFWSKDRSHRKPETLGGVPAHREVKKLQHQEGTYILEHTELKLFIRKQGQWKALLGPG